MFSFYGLICHKRVTMMSRDSVTDDTTLTFDQRPHLQRPLRCLLRAFLTTSPSKFSSIGTLYVFHSFELPCILTGPSVGYISFIESTPHCTCQCCEKVSFIRQYRFSNLILSFFLPTASSRHITMTRHINLKHVLPRTC